MTRTVKSYKITAIATRELVYLVDAVSPEEAEVVVEDYIADGEEPISSTLTDLAIDEVVPVEDDATGTF